MSKNTIKVVELFAGVGGFRIGLEGASDAYETIWNNQWEPSTKHQDASLVYRARFGSKGHSNQDINTVPTADIPDHDLLVGGFPCQDYSVAKSLKMKISLDLASYNVVEANLDFLREISKEYVDILFGEYLHICWLFYNISYALNRC
mgnify:CR=1 FL=1